MRYSVVPINDLYIKWAQTLYPELFQDELDHINRITNNSIVFQERLLGICQAKKLVAELFDISFASTHIFYNINGKPSIAIRGQHISISHTTGWVACAINNSPIGIDVENTSSFKKELPLCVFSDCELEYVGNASSLTEKLYRQCQIWTFKEAYFKAFGSGIPNYKSISFFDYRHLCYQKKIDDCFMTIFKTA